MTAEFLLTYVQNNFFWHCQEKLIDLQNFFYTDLFKDTQIPILAKGSVQMSYRRRRT